MSINKEALCQGKRFKIIHIYSSDYCKLRKVNGPFKVELALVNDILLTG